MSNPNSGQLKVDPALASPANYWEATFTAQAGVAYHLWVRMRAQSDSLANDSVMDYNTKRESFPGNIFAGMFNFGPAELLQATESPEEKKAPQVKF